MSRRAAIARVVVARAAEVAAFGLAVAGTAGVWAWFWPAGCLLATGLLLAVSWLVSR